MIYQVFSNDYDGGHGYHIQAVRTLLERYFIAIVLCTIATYSSHLIHLAHFVIMSLKPIRSISSVRQLSIRAKKAVIAVIAIFSGFYALNILPATHASSAIMDDEKTIEALKKRSMYVLYPRTADEAIDEIAAHFKTTVDLLRDLQAQAAVYGWKSKATLIPYNQTTESQHYYPYVVHQMQKGESLGSLALIVKHSEQELQNVNSLMLSSNELKSLREGDWIILPVPVEWWEALSEDSVPQY